MEVRTYRVVFMGVMGATKAFSRGEVVTIDDLGDWFPKHLELGAIVPVAEVAAIETGSVASVSIRDPAILAAIEAMKTNPLPVSGTTSGADEPPAAPPGKEPKGK